ncbi:hypothetical protein SAMN00120144_1532 [Hymenobacter roseosalivarius DSM 11622]|uniref:Uncharacterized protein n=1 Tax=Hymenobacter roseosalivarius DSM 11622 TaxID=645990 RepID=A0A1W1V1X0_9BACT|nr:hypothetical protein SAMN00120144_1532 [Hymenobacter roseosalivarius DSM 11622]
MQSASVYGTKDDTGFVLSLHLKLLAVSVIQAVTASYSCYLILPKNWLNMRPFTC